MLFSASLYFGTFAGWPTGVSTGFTDLSLTSRPTPASLLQTRSLTGHRDDLLNVAWSLVVELQISILFPLLLSVRRRTIIPFGGYLFLSIICIVIRSRTDQWLVSALAQTAQFAYLFVAGILLQQHLDAARRRVAASSWPVVAIGWIFALNLLLVRMYTPGVKGRLL